MTDDRPARKKEIEIEVTPEMIKAGRSAIDDFYLGNGSYEMNEEYFISIFREMTISYYKHFVQSL